MLASLRVDIDRKEFAGSLRSIGDCYVYIGFIAEVASPFEGELASPGNRRALTRSSDERRQRSSSPGRDAASSVSCWNRVQVHPSSLQSIRGVPPSGYEPRSTVAIAEERSCTRDGLTHLLGGVSTAWPERFANLAWAGRAVENEEGDELVRASGVLAVVRCDSAE